VQEDDRRSFTLVVHEVKTKTVSDEKAVDQRRRSASSAGAERHVMLHAVRHRLDLFQ
jgi:hypothetical protein